VPSHLGAGAAPVFLDRPVGAGPGWPSTCETAAQLGSTPTGYRTPGWGSALIEARIEDFLNEQLRRRSDRKGHQSPNYPEQRTPMGTATTVISAGTFIARPIILGTSR
jgi:hypothetical protein